MKTDAIVARWVAEAAVLRRRGAPAQAEALESCAAELAEESRRQASESLDMTTAVAESGYSRSALEKMISRGHLVNLGEPGSPRIRRGDLPRKGGRGADPAASSAVLQMVGR